MSLADHLHLSAHFDCVVMLTWSNWHTELRSNRYNYAVRFARQLPIIFVQPDLAEATFQFENTEIDNLVLLHIYNQSGHPKQRDLLNQALQSRHFIKPLLWIYNFSLVDIVIHRYAPLKVYHATEDYFSPEFVLDHNIEGQKKLLEKLRSMLAHVDLVVTVSEGVRDSFVQNSQYQGEYLVLPNGCDFSFWAPKEEEFSQFSAQNGQKKVAFYQGGINGKIDFEILDRIIMGMPDWEFWFCGDVQTHFDEWQALTRHPNLKYFGRVGPEQVRDLAYQATVGIIPFIQTDLFIGKSLPLKTFEYVACGLPVVTIPIKSLLPFPGIFQFAQSAQEFIDAIRQVAPSRYDTASLNMRLAAAKQQDYDKRFETLISKINSLIVSRPLNQTPLNILILYDDRSTHISTIKEHLEGFSLFSRNHIFYAVATIDVYGLEKKKVEQIYLSSFDVVIIHYSVRLSLDWHLSSLYAEALSKFSGFKVLFIQDEYDTTETARQWIEKLGIHAVFTCVPPEYVEAVYPSTRFPYVEFVQTLTGYVPIRFEAAKQRKPLCQRTFLIGYRGRALPYWYGDLGQEKLFIGQQMREICEARGIAADIEWEADKRIYGENWYEFLEDCKATLGTESGSNVFDDYGEIQKNIEAALAQEPTLSYAEIRAKYLAEHEGKIIMNQVSPKIFEATALKTALVLFEGTYSGVVKPELHYIPLKKDFSNIDEVLAKLQDDSYLEELTERAYNDIVKSGLYSYRKFIQDVDHFLAQRLPRSNRATLLVGLIGHQPSFANSSQINFDRTLSIRSMLTNKPLLATQISDADAATLVALPAPLSVNETAETVPLESESSPVSEPLPINEVQDPGETVETTLSEPELSSVPVLLPASDAQLLITPTGSLVRIILYRIKTVSIRELVRYPLLFRLSRSLYRAIRVPLRFFVRGLWQWIPRRFRDANRS